MTLAPTLRQAPQQDVRNLETLGQELVAIRHQLEGFLTHLNELPDLIDREREILKENVQRVMQGLPNTNPFQQEAEVHESPLSEHHSLRTLEKTLYKLGKIEEDLTRHLREAGEQATKGKILPTLSSINPDRRIQTTMNRLRECMNRLGVKPGLGTGEERTENIQQLKQRWKTHRSNVAGISLANRVRGLILLLTEEGYTNPIETLAEILFKDSRRTVLLTTLLNNPTGRHAMGNPDLIEQTLNVEGF